MIVEKMAALPAVIEFEGVTFELQIINNCSTPTNMDIRLVYDISGALPDSPHRESIDMYGCWQNPFIPGACRGFLYLYERIETDEELGEALDHCMKFLEEAGLLNGKDA
jgi:hypothetical protein